MNIYTSSPFLKYLTQQEVGAQQACRRMRQRFDSQNFRQDERRVSLQKADNISAVRMRSRTNQNEWLDLIFIELAACIFTSGKVEYRNYILGMNKISCAAREKFLFTCGLNQKQEKSDFLMTEVFIFISQVRDVKI